MSKSQTVRYNFVKSLREDYPDLDIPSSTTGCFQSFCYDTGKLIGLYFYKTVDGKEVKILEPDLQ